MQNVPIPASAMPLPVIAAINFVPGATDQPSDSNPASDDFSAVLARHVIKEAPGLEPATVLPDAVMAGSQIEQPGGEMAPLQAPPGPGTVVPMVSAVLALMPGIHPGDRVSGDPRQIAGKAPAAVPSPEIPAQRGFPEAVVPDRRVVASDNAADLAVPGKFPTSVAAEDGEDFAAPGKSPTPVAAEDGTDFVAPGKFPTPVAAKHGTLHSATADTVTHRFPDVAPLPPLPPITHSQRASASAPASHEVNLEIRVAARGWDGELAQKVVWMATRHQQAAEMHLNPPHLGPMDVMVTIGNNPGDQASVQFASPHLAVREAIEAALPRLRDMMADSGISLGNVTVSADSFQPQAEGGRQDRSLMKQPADIPEAAIGLVARPTATFIRSGRNGLVDTFA